MGAGVSSICGAARNLEENSGGKHGKPAQVKSGGI